MDDLISRWAAIDVLVKDCKASDEGMLNMYDIVCDLQDIPSAQRNPGKWKPISDGYLEIYECDQCGETEDYERNFCPNCGADMRGVERRTDE